jgi:hypothetical protein
MRYEGTLRKYSLETGELSLLTSFLTERGFSVGGSILDGAYPCAKIYPLGSEKIEVLVSEGTRLHDAFLVYSQKQGTTKPVPVASGKA